MVLIILNNYFQHIFLINWMLGTKPISKHHIKNKPKEIIRGVT